MKGSHMVKSKKSTKSLHPTLWARDQDAFDVIRRSRGRSQLATLYVNLIWENFGKKSELYIFLFTLNIIVTYIKCIQPPSFPLYASILNN